MRIISPGYGNTNAAALYVSAAGGLLDGSESDGTNLLSTTDFSDFNTLNSSLTTNAALAPNGATAASSMLEDTNNARHILYKDYHFTITGGTSHTYSLYAKSNGRRYIQLCVGKSPYIYAYFDLQTGTVTDSGTISPDGSTVVSATSCDAGANGFYKCSLTGIIDTSTANPYQIIATSDVATYGSPLDSQSPAFVGSTSTGVYLWRTKVV